MSNAAAPVLRFESPEDPPTEFRDLASALREPPCDPDSRITQGGRLLAEADPERCSWRLTALGREVRWQEPERLLSEYRALSYAKTEPPPPPSEPDSGFWQVA